MASDNPVHALADLIRRIDGNHDMGTGNLAEALIAAGVRMPDPAEQRATTRLAANSANKLARKLTQQADSLRQIAEELDRCAIDTDRLALNGPQPHLANYAAIAARAQHRILWGVANLNLDGVTTTAAEADEYRIRAEQHATKED